MEGGRTSLTLREEGEARDIARTDPRVIQLLGDTRPTVGRIGPIGLENGEIAGAVVELNFATPVTITGKRWIRTVCTTRRGQRQADGTWYEVFEQPMDVFAMSTLIVEIDLERRRVIELTPSSAPPGQPGVSISIPPDYIAPRAEKDCPPSRD